MRPFERSFAGEWGRGRQSHDDRSLLDVHVQLYGVSAKRLNEQIKRNRKRFPEDFVFQLTTTEWDALRSQIATSKQGRGGARYAPCAFTEHGAIMAANVLNSSHAVRASVHVVRAFVRLRQALVAHRELAQKVNELELKVGTHDTAVTRILHAIRQLMEPPPEPPKERIGFRPPSAAPDAGDSGTRGA